MAGKLISLEEAAAMLGVSPEKLSEMRQRQEVFGVRDGGGWKFKIDDIERFKSEKASASSDSSLPIDLDDLELGESKTDVVLSEFELGESGPGSSTVIGSGNQKPGGSDIELKLGGSDAGSGLNLLSGSVLGNPAPPTPSPGGSGIDFNAGTSGLDLGGGSGSGLDLLGSGSLAGPLSDVKLASGTNIGMGSNVLSGGSSGGSGPDAGKTMLTAELADKAGPESSIKMSMRDSESVFGEPDSDVSRHIEGSGINLLDARDSGLNLDDLQLASVSGIGGKKKSGGSDLDMKGEEDFLLTPLEEQGDDSTDSGSQVIALEGDFGDDATATLMAGDVPGLGQMLEDAGGGMGGLGSPMGQPGPTVYMAPPEPSYGIGTVLSLGVSSALLTLVGIMMYDLIRHMWSWDTPYSFNSTIMDTVLSLF